MKIYNELGHVYKFWHGISLYKYSMRNFCNYILNQKFFFPYRSIIIRKKADKNFAQALAKSDQMPKRLIAQIFFEQCKNFSYFQLTLWIAREFSHRYFHISNKSYLLNIFGYPATPGSKSTLIFIFHFSHQ